MAKEIKAPNPYKTDGFTIFLGGAIDQGEAEDWQAKVVEALEDLDVTILNPRRDNWDSSWEQDIENKEFRQQVEWELKAQEDASLVLYVLLEDSKGPVTMLEIGHFAPDKDAVLCIEEGFYRQGNLDIFAKRYKIPIYHDFDEMLDDLHEILKALKTLKELPGE